MRISGGSMSKKKIAKLTPAQQAARAHFQRLIVEAKVRNAVGFLKFLSDCLVVWAATALLGDGDYAALCSAILSHVAAQHPEVLDRCEANMTGLKLGMEGVY